MKKSRCPIRHPGLVLDDLSLPDTPHNRRLLEQVDGVFVADFSDGRCSVRAMRHPDVSEVFEAGTCWLVGYVYDDHVEVKLHTCPAQKADLLRAS